MKDFIIFDFETNGLQGSSVLSISALKVRLIQDWSRLLPVKSFNRFYFIKPGEGINIKALKVHRLTGEILKKHRQCVDYPKYFVEDIPAFLDFKEGCDLAVGHGIEFDLSFIPNGTFNKYFCTMKANTPRGQKWPKLSQVAKRFGIFYNSSELHQSDYDVGVTLQVFEKMLFSNLIDKNIFL